MGLYGSNVRPHCRGRGNPTRRPTSRLAPDLPEPNAERVQLRRLRPRADGWLHQARTTRGQAQGSPTRGNHRHTAGVLPGLRRSPGRQDRSRPEGRGSLSLPEASRTRAATCYYVRAQTRPEPEKPQEGQEGQGRRGEKEAWKTSLSTTRASKPQFAKRP